MKNTLNGDNGRLDIAEEKISEHEIETLENVEWKENYKKKNTQSIKELWDIRWPNICVIEISKGKEKSIEN